MYFKAPGLTLDKLWEKVQEFFWGYPKEKIEGAFLSLMDVMNNIIDENGGNDYELGHHSRLEKHKARGQNVPAVLFVTTTAIKWDYPPSSYLPTDNDSETDSESERENNGIVLFDI